MDMALGECFGGVSSCVDICILPIQHQILDFSNNLISPRRVNLEARMIRFPIGSRHHTHPLPYLKMEKDVATCRQKARQRTRKPVPNHGLELGASTMHVNHLSAMLRDLGDVWKSEGKALGGVIVWS